LLTEIQSLDKEIDNLTRKINKEVKEIGEYCLDDLERRYRYLERIKDDYEYGRQELSFIMRIELKSIWLMLRNQMLSYRIEIESMRGVDKGIPLSMRLGTFLMQKFGKNDTTI